MAAHAHDVGSAAWRARALALADAFLVSQYRPEDAPFLVGAEPLVGGLRSGPRELDVQIDTVQHAGCAMLGALALLEGDGPGRFP